MISQLFTVLFLSVVAVLFGILLLTVTALIGPKLTPTKRKMMPYECGVVGEETETTRIPIKFYLTAILFILFDIEIVFMYPWALVYMDYIRQASGAFIYFEMLVFMAILVWGLFYVWRGRALQWE